jgi:hypothetical protein
MFQFIPAILSAVASAIPTAASAAGTAAATAGQLGLNTLATGGNIIGSGMAAGMQGAGSAIGSGSKFLMGSSPGAGLAGPAQQGFLGKTLGTAGAKKLGGTMVESVAMSTLSNALRPKPKEPIRSMGSTYSPGFNVQPGTYNRVNNTMKKKYGRTFFV